MHDVIDMTLRYPDATFGAMYIIRAMYNYLQNKLNYSKDNISDYLSIKSFVVQNFASHFRLTG